MLNDDDRRLLADLEQRVRLGDPEFAARTAAPRFPTLSVLGAALFVLVPPVFLLFGRPGLLVTVHLFLGAVVAVLVHRHQHR
jgi:hypothetical protein